MASAYCFQQRQWRHRWPCPSVVRQSLVGLQELAALQSNSLLVLALDVGVSGLGGIGLAGTLDVGLDLVLGFGLVELGGLLLLGGHGGLELIVVQQSLSQSLASVIHVVRISVVKGLPSGVQGIHGLLSGLLILSNAAQSHDGIVEIAHHSAQSQLLGVGEGSHSIRIFAQIL